MFEGDVFALFESESCGLPALFSGEGLLSDTGARDRDRRTAS